MNAGNVSYSLTELGNENLESEIRKLFEWSNDELFIETDNRNTSNNIDSFTKTAILIRISWNIILHTALHLKENISCSLWEIRTLGSRMHYSVDLYNFLLYKST